MGALAPVSTWSPQDDLLLKNSVEAGASLESLARGAVQFSKRFTVQELQERWQSLLYDPVISAEASACMIEFEHATSSLSKKPNKKEVSKETAYGSGKRKIETVRKCYYAMRKRICNEPFGSMDLNFLAEPGNNNCIENQVEPPSANCMLEDPISNSFGAQESNFGTTHHAFPQIPMVSVAGGDIDANSRTYHTGFQNQVENLPIDQDNIQGHTFSEHLPIHGSYLGVEEMDQPKELPVCGIFEDDHLEAKALATFDQSNNAGTLCSGFGGSQSFNSPTSDCGASFQNLYSSPLPQMPIWSTIDSISAPTLPDVHLSEDEHCTRDTFVIPDNSNANDAETSGYDVIHSGFELKNQMPCDNMTNSTPGPNDYLAAISETLFNLTNDEELLYVDGDGKDEISKSYIDGFGSLLLDSPNVDGIPNITGAEASVTQDEDLAISGGFCLQELDESGGSLCGDRHTLCNSEAKKILPLSISGNPRFPELRNGVICCTLNTEDPEIPSNDDVFLPIHNSSPDFSSVTQLKSRDVNYLTPSFLRDCSDKKRRNAKGPSLIKKEGNVFEKSYLPSVVGLQFPPERGLNYPAGNRGVKFELPNRDCPQVVYSSESTACEGPNHITSATSGEDCIRPAILDYEATEIGQGKHQASMSANFQQQKSLDRFDSGISYPPMYASCSEQNVDAAVKYQSQASHGQSCSALIAVPETVVNPSLAEQEVLPSESDDDVPYFSDVEAMILDMDLSPDDQDFLTSQEVSRYQHEDSKRAIIRLEQAAHSYMQRLLASQGAFAVLYGRRSKHYIRKPEVLVGRATEEVHVDIDLAREGRANKISRRQAIIKMDESGSFYLKNLGKYPIFVNDKGVGPKQRISLTSGCLIEMRGLAFIFETNQTFLKQYVDNMIKERKLQENSEQL